MKPNKFINASYQLYDVTEGNKELLEETNESRPFTFITGLGLLLDAFERQLIDLENGSEFDFVLTPAQAYGEYSDDNVLEMDKEVFNVDGRFDDKNVYEEAIIPLQDETGKRFSGRVAKITDTKVTIDMNHPLAGKSLNFKGKINETREATNEELSLFVERLTGQGSSCGCGGDCGCGGSEESSCGCGGEGNCGCGGDHSDSEKGSCGCGGDHKDGECCGGNHKEGECCGKGGKGEGHCQCKD